jgi:RNA polymerase sigma-70 factor (ECF subfamily)
MMYMGKFESFSSKTCTPLNGVSQSAWVYPNLHELELIARVKRGDHDAFYELVRPYEKAIYGAAYSVLRNEADAEEIAQETVLRAFSSIANFRGECKVSTWLIQITLNEARARVRKDRRHLYDSMDEPLCDSGGELLPQDIADWRALPSDALEQSELRNAISERCSSFATFRNSASQKAQRSSAFEKKR